VTATTITRRHLALLANTTPTLTPVPNLENASQIPAPHYELAAKAEDAARDASLEAGAVDQQRALIAKVMADIADLPGPGAAMFQILRDYGQAMYRIGHMDGAETPDAPFPPLEIVKDTPKPRTLKAVKP
jgi:hypothetical protein